MADEPDWQRLIEGLREGDERIAAEFYQRYGPLLESIAARHLSSDLRRRVGPDSVAHSACRTFLRRIREGQFELDGRERLWNLLCAITLGKARKKSRFHMAHKRGVGRELRIDDEGPLSGRDVESPAPTPAEAAEFADEFEHLLEALDAEEREIVCLKLEHRTNDEIAAALGCSERTVRRLLKRVEQRLAAGA